MTQKGNSLSKASSLGKAPASAIPHNRSADLQSALRDRGPQTPSPACGHSKPTESRRSALGRLGPFRPRQAMVLLSCVGALLSFAPYWARADQVEMQNGDRYVGNVVSLNTNTLVLENEVLGMVRLPRGKVALITLGSRPPVSVTPLPSPANGQVRAPSSARAAAATNPSPELRKLAEHTNLIQQVQRQFLGDAGPEANQKFDELLSGLMSGKLTVDDLRAQAQSAADQLRALKREGGEDAGFAADTYLAILDHFLKGSPPAGTGTNAPPRPPASKPDPVPSER